MFSHYITRFPKFTQPRGHQRLLILDKVHNVSDNEVPSLLWHLSFLLLSAGTQPGGVRQLIRTGCNPVNIHQYQFILRTVNRYYRNSIWKHFHNPELAVIW